MAFGYPAPQPSFMVISADTDDLAVFFEMGVWQFFTVRMNAAPDIGQHLAGYGHPDESTEATLDEIPWTVPFNGYGEPNMKRQRTVVLAATC